MRKSHGSKILAMSLALVAWVASTGFAAPWADQPRSFVFFPDESPGSSRQFLESLRQAGGHATVIYPGSGAIVYATPAQLDAVDAWIAERHEGEIGDSRFTLRDEKTALVARAWNHDLQLRSSDADLASPRSHSHAGEYERGSTGRNIPVDLPEMPVRRDAPDHIPMGSEYYDTSAYLAGTTAVGVWLLEGAGSAYTWTATEETETLTGIQQGFDSWAAFDEVSAWLTFFVDIHTGVPVSDDPITHPQGTESTWIGEALTAGGWPGASAWEQCYEYNNDLRDSFETNWCYSLFIVDSDELVNEGLFSTGGYAWAYYGGPWIYMSRYSTWGYNAENYFHAVPMHEMGHIFWATDEYDGGAQQTQGYLNLPDSPNGAVLCLMNQNAQNRICGYSKRQVSWKDADADNVMEPLDTEPDATVDELLPDPTSDVTPTWTGSANVNTIPNLNSNDPFYSPPHAMTINTIAAVECRVDGGAWMPATPTDGTFDAYVESFSWTSLPLGPGVHVMEARAQNARGNWSSTYGTDTITVEGGEVGVDDVVAVPAFRLEPARPNPAHNSAIIRYSLTRSAPVRVSVHGVTGARVRTLFDGAKEPGSHSVRWNGKDDRGREVPTGVYLVRLESVEGTRSSKLVWQR